MKKAIQIILTFILAAHFFSGCDALTQKPGSKQEILVNDGADTDPDIDKDNSSEPTPTPASTPEPTPEPTPAPTPTPEPTPEPTPTPEPLNVRSPYFENYGSPYNADGTLSNKRHGWYINKNAENEPPTAQREFDIRQFDGVYLGDITKKVFYLTFDEGYENGFTPAILDTLREKGVEAAFFMTRSFVASNVDLVKRIVEEGHVAANHSAKHLSPPDLTDEQVIQEIEDTAVFFEETIGHSMEKFFRPPAGEYSARTLKLTQGLGYKSVFWSAAHVDWDVDKQPTVDETYNIIMKNLHPGGIILLHAVSSANTNALGRVIDAIREQGYEFGSLRDLQ